MSMITAVQWVPRGFAAPFPKKSEFDEAEFERIAELAKLQLDDANEDLEDAKEAAKNGTKSEAGSSKEKSENGTSNESAVEKSDDPALDDDLKEYDLEHYDDEDDGNGGSSMAMFGNVKSLAYYESNKEDPYIRLDEEAKAEEEEDREDLQVLATDNLVLTAREEDDLAQLVVHVYEDGASNLYVHHDIMLPATPLCLEWLDLPVNKQGASKDSVGNFVAIGTMDPDIEIWDLDTVECMFPNAILGQGASADAIKGKKKKKKSKKKRANDEYHVDAVLSLAANRKHRNLLASASADKTIKLWDLHTAKCAKSYSYHTDKVCSVAWHSAESTVLLSGSYDRTVVAADMRAPDAQVPRWGVESDVETVRWDPHDANFFYVSTERGTMHYHDVRQAPAKPEATKAVWTLQAHDDVLSSFDINPVIPGFLATGSFDKTVKLWNIQPAGPSIVVSREFEDVGKVFATSFAPDPEVAFRLAVAGSRGDMHVWDTSTNRAVRSVFATRVPDVAAGTGEDRIVGVDDDSSSESEEEEEEEEGGVNIGGNSMDEDDE